MALSSLCILRFLLCSFLESLSDFTICAEPGPVIPQGNFITIVCSTSGEYDTVRLEKEGSTFMEKKTEPHGKQHRFRIGPVNETITGYYNCIFEKNYVWSQRSNDLQLKVIKENVTQGLAPGPSMTSGLFLEPWVLTIAVIPCLHLLWFFITPGSFTLPPSSHVSLNLTVQIAWSFTLIRHHEWLGYSYSLRDRVQSCHFLLGSNCASAVVEAICS